LCDRRDSGSTGRGLEALVEGLVGLPDGEHLVDQLAHAVPKSDTGAFSGLNLPGIQGLDGRIAAGRGQGGHPEHLTDEVTSLHAHALIATNHRSPLFVDTGGIEFREDAEVADELRGGLESLDRKDFGNQDRGGARTNSGNGNEMLMATGGELFQGEFDPGETLGFSFLTVTNGLDRLNDEFLSILTTERASCRAGCLPESLGEFGSEMGDLGEGRGSGGGDASRCGIAAKQFEHPLFGDVFGDQGELGKDAGEEFVQLVDAAGGLSGEGDEGRDEIVKFQQFGRGWGEMWRLFDDGEPGTGGAIDGIRLGLGIMGVFVIAVAFGFTDRKGDVEGEFADEGLEIGGILTSRINPDLEQDLIVVSVSEVLEGFVQGLITNPGFLKCERTQSGGAVLVGESDMMSVPGGVDADTNEAGG
jgi:hypothetical protein